MATYRIAVPAHIYLDVEAPTEGSALAIAARLARELADGADLSIAGADHVRVYADDEAPLEIVDEEDSAVSPLHPVLDDDYDSDYEDQP